MKSRLDRLQQLLFMTKSMTIFIAVKSETDEWLIGDLKLTFENESVLDEFIKQQGAHVFKIRII